MNFFSKVKNISTLHSQQRRVFVAVVFVLLLVGSAAYLSRTTITERAPAENTYVAFTGEVFSMIQEKHWSNPNEETLVELYRKAVEKIDGTQHVLSSADKEGILMLVESIVESVEPADKKEEIVAQINDIVLANLQPFGRSRLFTTTKVQELRDTVANKDSQANLYDTLGISENATQDDIDEAYRKKIQGLSAKNSPETQQELQVVEEAYDTLAAQETRETYNTTGAQATIVGEQLTPSINYIQIKQMSPISFEEFQRVARKLDTGIADSLIIDLRDNIGGAIDILPYFLGPFIGPESYAYEFYSQGKRVPFKTKTGWMNSLVRYKKVVVLINENTQSSGEVMAAVLKKYNVGVVVGTTTRGRGTVENTFPIETRLSPNEHYSLFLVHSVTLRDDGQPIEGRGVDPTVSLESSDWRNQLFKYFNYQPLVIEVGKLVE